MIKREDYIFFNIKVEKNSEKEYIFLRYAYIYSISFHFNMKANDKIGNYVISRYAQNA